MSDGPMGVNGPLVAKLWAQEKLKTEALESQLREARAALDAADKRIYDAGMMLCCVNDIECNPLEDLIKGNLQMLSGYHESEKRLEAALEALRLLQQLQKVVNTNYPRGAEALSEEHYRLGSTLK